MNVKWFEQYHTHKHILRPFWHQLSHMQVCTLLQTDNHASTLPLTRVAPDKGLLNVCLCSGTTRVSRYQKDKTDLDFTEARDSEWQ